MEYVEGNLCQLRRKGLHFLPTLHRVLGATPDGVQAGEQVLPSFKLDVLTTGILTAILNKKGLSPHALALPGPPQRSFYPRLDRGIFGRNLRNLTVSNVSAQPRRNIRSLAWLGNIHPRLCRVDARLSVNMKIKSMYIINVRNIFFEALQELGVTGAGGHHSTKINGSQSLGHQAFTDR
jgi:hypothetical protein